MATKNLARTPRIGHERGEPDGSRQRMTEPRRQDLAAVRGTRGFGVSLRRPPADGDDFDLARLAADD
jgi:hypothetical protein